MSIIFVKNKADIIYSSLHLNDERKGRASEATTEKRTIKQGMLRMYSLFLICYNMFCVDAIFTYMFTFDYVLVLRIQVRVPLRILTRILCVC